MYCTAKTIIIVMLMFGCWAEAKTTRKITSSQDALAEKDISLVLESRVSQIIKETDYDKKLSKLEDLLNIVDDGYNRYQNIMPDTKANLDSIKDQNSEEFKKANKDFAEKGLLLEKWTEIQQALEPANIIFVKQEESEFWNCDTVMNRIDSNIDTNQNASKELRDYTALAKKLTGNMCKARKKDNKS